MYFFYCPDIETAPALPEEESYHCIKVLRHTRGDVLFITDGKGNIFRTQITKPHQKCCEVVIISKERQPRKHDFYLHIAIAPTKNIERIEWMLEKCTEIGIDEITPLLCRFSERKQLRTDRLEKIVISAAKQSLNTTFPRLNELTDYDTFIHTVKADTRFIAHCYQDERRTLKQEIQKGKSCLILIGPEGDFSEQEVSTAISLGFIPVSLGNTRLRTETAGVVACHTAIIMNA